MSYCCVADTLCPSAFGTIEQRTNTTNQTLRLPDCPYRWSGEESHWFDEVEFSGRLTRWWCNWSLIDWVGGDCHWSNRGTWMHRSSNYYLLKYLYISKLTQCVSHINRLSVTNIMFTRETHRLVINHDMQFVWETIRLWLFSISHQAHKTGESP